MHDLKSAGLHACAQLVDKIMSEDTGFATVGPGDEAVLIVNNLGSTPPVELYCLANAALRYLASVKQVTQDGP